MPVDLGGASGKVVFGPVTLRSTWTPSAPILATMWSGRATTSEEAAWSTTAAGSDIAFSTAGYYYYLWFEADLAKSSGTTVGLRWDSLSIVTKYVAGLSNPRTGGTFTIGTGGGTTDSKTPGYYSGMLDEPVIGHSPTKTWAQIATYLYNSGSGHALGCPWPDYATYGNPVGWDLDESSGIRASTPTGTFLTDSGTVTAATGNVAPCYVGTGGVCFAVDPSPPETFTIEVTSGSYYPSPTTTTVTFSTCSTGQNTTLFMNKSTFSAFFVGTQCGGGCQPLWSGTATANGSSVSVSSAELGSCHTDSPLTNSGDCTTTSISLSVTDSRGIYQDYSGSFTKNTCCNDVVIGFGPTFSDNYNCCVNSQPIWGPGRLTAYRQLTMSSSLNGTLGTAPLLGDGGGGYSCLHQWDKTTGGHTWRYTFNPSEKVVVRTRDNDAYSTQTCLLTGSYCAGVGVNLTGTIPADVYVGTPDTITVTN